VRFPGTEFQDRRGGDEGKDDKDSDEKAGGLKKGPQSKVLEPGFVGEANKGRRAV